MCCRIILSNYQATPLRGAGSGGMTPPDGERRRVRVDQVSHSPLGSVHLRSPGPVLSQAVLTQQQSAGPLG
jgi:hypothetical protein